MIFIYDTHMQNDISSSFFHSFKILIFIVVWGRVSQEPYITSYDHHLWYNL